MIEKTLTGLWKILTWFFSRPTLEVRISEDNIDQEIGGLKFEVENISRKTTSLRPTISASYLTVDRKGESVVFDVRQENRNLPPFTAKSFSASAREPKPNRENAWFRVYKFSPTKGRTKRVRIRNASLDKTGFFRFLTEKLLFKVTGRLFYVKTSMTMDEHRAQKRSRGPH